MRLVLSTHLNFTTNLVITRCNGSRKSNSKCAAAVINYFLILKLNNYLLTRANICHIRNKHIGALLAYKGRLLTCFFSLLVFFFGLYLFINLAFNDSLTYTHSHGMYGAFIRQWKNVARINRKRVFVLISLRNYNMIN